MRFASLIVLAAMAPVSFCARADNLQTFNVDVYANLDQTHFANLIFLVTFDPSQDYSNFTPGVQLVTAITNDRPLLDSFYQQPSLPISLLNRRLCSLRAVPVLMELFHFMHLRS